MNGLGIMNKIGLLICLVTLLCSETANALKCYEYDDDGDKMCLADEDCTDKSQIVTCPDDKTWCAFRVEVS